MAYFYTITYKYWLVWSGKSKHRALMFCVLDKYWDKNSLIVHIISFLHNLF